MRNKIDYSRNTKRHITTTIKQLGKYSSKVPIHQHTKDIKEEQFSGILAK